MKKKLLAIMLAVVMLLTLAACGDSGSEEPSKPSTPSEPDTSTQTPEPEPSPEPEQKKEDAYEITYTNVKTYTNSIGTAYAQVIVEIENTGTTDLYMSSGSYDIEDADGNLVASSSLVSTYPDVISPGEKAYMYEENMLDEAIDGELTVLARPDAEKSKVEKIRYSVSDVAISTDKYGDVKAIGRVENTSEEDGSMVYIVFILKDSSGNPIGQIFTILMEDLAAGDKIGFEASAMSLPDDVTEESIASYDVFAYPMQMQF